MSETKPATVSVPQQVETPQPIAQPLPQQIPATPGPVSTPTNDAVIGVIPGTRKMKSLGRYDEYNLVLTSNELIAAQITPTILKDVASKAKEQAKSDGKGFFGQWGAQLSAGAGYARRYLSMSPSDILAETVGNFAINNNTINRINMKVKPNSKGRSDNYETDLEIEFVSTLGGYEFRMDDYSENVDLLKQVFGDRVKMPFGYSVRRSHGIRVKL